MGNSAIGNRAALGLTRPLPDRAVVTAGLARMRTVIDRIAAAVDEPARARRAGDLTIATVLPDRRLAEPDLEFRASCARRGLSASSTPQLQRVWDAWQAGRYQRGETGQRPGYTGSPFRPTLITRPPCPRSGNWTP